jgi:hypothetical protein
MLRVNPKTVVWRNLTMTYDILSTGSAIYYTKWDSSMKMGDVRMKNITGPA